MLKRPKCSTIFDSVHRLAVQWNAWQDINNFFFRINIYHDTQQIKKWKKRKRNEWDKLKDKEKWTRLTERKTLIVGLHFNSFSHRIGGILFQILNFYSLYFQLKLVTKSDNLRLWALQAKQQNHYIVRDE